NKVLGEIVAVEERGGGLEELIPLMAGDRIKEAWETGNVDGAPLMVGQSIGLINDIPTCRELLDTMANEAIETLRKTNDMVVSE
ncbi:MAG: nitronate monooxygenase, partial [Deltaproteobacteria bacterium]|nr:nitronate monooxygenase [Deltaproteobacteria bacterium]